MTDRSTEVHLAVTRRMLSHRLGMWSAMAAAMFAASYLLSCRIDVSLISPMVLMMALVTSEGIHRTFQMGDMDSVLVLHRDLKDASGRFIRMGMVYTVSFTLLAVTAVLVGAFFRIGADGIGPEGFASALFMFGVGNLIVLLRWISAVRLGRRDALIRAVPFAVLALVSVPIHYLTDGWETYASILAMELILIWLVCEGVRYLREPSKSRMSGGIRWEITV